MEPRDVWRQLWADPELRKALLPATEADATIDVELLDVDDEDLDAALGMTALTGALVAQGRFPGVNKLRKDRGLDGLPFMSFDYRTDPPEAPANPRAFRQLFAFSDLSASRVLGGKSDPAVNAANLLSCVLNDLNCQNASMESVFGTFVHHVTPWTFLQKSRYLANQQRAVRTRDAAHYDATQRVVAQIESLGIVTFMSGALVAELETALAALGATDVRFYGNMMRPPPLTIPFAVWDASKHTSDKRGGMGFSADMLLRCTTREHGDTVVVVELKTTYVPDRKQREPESPDYGAYLRQAGMQALAVAFALQDVDVAVLPLVVMVHVPRTVERLPAGARTAQRSGCYTRHVPGNVMRYRDATARRVVVDMIQSHYRKDRDELKNGFEIVKTSGKNATTKSELEKLCKSLLQPRFRGLARYSWSQQMK